MGFFSKALLKSGLKRVMTFNHIEVYMTGTIFSSNDVLKKKKILKPIATVRLDFSGLQLHVLYE